MLKNYIKIIWRNILREKGFSLINVFSLAIGITFCILIYLFVHHEFTFDRFHESADRIFRVEQATIQPDGSISEGNEYGPIALGPALKADVPGIEQFIRFHTAEYFVRAGDGSDEAIEEPVLFADPSVLDVFTFLMLQGNPATALSAPDNVVLTETMAQKYFGDSNPIGKILQLRLGQTFEDFVVTGITRDVPDNSTIRFGILLSFEKLFMFDNLYRENADSWQFSWPNTYVKLDQGTTEQQVESRMPGFYEKYHEGAGSGDSGEIQTYDLKPIQDIHLTSDSDPAYSYILSSIALAVLVIGCINFMMLSVGRSTRRAKEIGLRKVAGAARKQIMTQFWGEALLLSGIALLLGLIMAEGFLPVFNTLTGKELEINMTADWTMGIVLIGLVFVTSLVAGSYPALVLSGFQPIETLNKRLHLGRTGNFAKSLIIVQFAVTVFLFTSTIIMARQLNLTRSMDLGFNREQVVVIPTAELDTDQIINRFQADLQQQSGIVDITASGGELGQTNTPGIGIRVNGEPLFISVFRTDDNYIDFLGLELVEGRDFNLAQDMGSNVPVIINETLVSDLELEDPIGQVIPVPWADRAASPEIIGVVKDYHFQSLYREFEPVILTLNPLYPGPFMQYDKIMVRIRPGSIPQTLALLEDTWQSVVSELPFTYYFLDEHMQDQYASARQWGLIIRYAALFSAFIACLGLLGLTALMMTRRTKEIGIRKVLGAKIHHIVVLASKEFSLLVITAIVLAIPMAYIAMQNWLADFAYRVPLSAWIFLMAGLVALGIALITVGSLAARSALMNPVESLRSE